MRHFVTKSQEFATLAIWVCLKMGYTPNYSLLVGIMIINQWVYGYTIFRQTHMTFGRDLALQLEVLDKDDAVTLICSTLAGEERLHLTAPGVDSAWETHRFGR